MGKQAILATFLVAATFLAVPAHGDIFNGDFSGAMTGWEDLSAANRANSASVNAGGAVLHLHSSRNYSWDDVELLWGTSGVTTAEVRQTAIYAPAGTTTLQFDAQTVFGTNPNVAVDKNCYLELDVYYNSGTLQGYSSSNTSNGGMQGYTIDLPGLDTAQPIVIDVLVESVSLSKWDLPDGTNGNPTSYDLTSTVNVDNIRFTPEPVSMAVLAIGSLVLVRRRR